jgi:predicted LPLAT superfamily acyltransferase
MKHWTEKSERGSVWLIQVIVWLARRAGRLVCRVLLFPIVFYFLLTDSMARRSSAEFLETVHGRKAHWRDVFSHIYSFAATLLDRVYMAAGDFNNFEVAVEGLALVDRALQAKKGCVLLGSHLGSFDLMMLVGGAMDGRMVNVMMRVDPRSRVRRIAGIDDSAFNLIPLGRPDSYLRAYEALSSGGIVAVLADRVDGAANLPVRFMDRTTSMPVAPHILAARSGAPILMFFGLYENRNRYRIEFVECGQAATSNSRGDQLQPAVNAYASVLEEYARRYPLNWFNFYPYWGTGGDGT